MEELPGAGEPYWARRWKLEKSWSARELAKLCCGWDPDTGWDPYCGWEPFVTGTGIFDEDEVARWGYADALNRVLRAERIGDLVAKVLPRAATAEELERGDAPVFDAREATTWASPRFPTFPFRMDPSSQHIETAGGGDPPAAEPTEGSPSTEFAPAAHRTLDFRPAVDQFIDRVLSETGRKISRTDIWRVAGYTDPTEFQRFQRSDPSTTAGSTAKFLNVLRMDSSTFIQRLDMIRRGSTE